MKWSTHINHALASFPSQQRTLAETMVCKAKLHLRSYWFCFWMWSI